MTPEEEWTEYRNNLKLRYGKGKIVPPAEREEAMRLLSAYRADIRRQLGPVDPSSLEPTPKFKQILWRIDNGYEYRNGRWRKPKME